MVQNTGIQLEKKSNRNSRATKEDTQRVEEWVQITSKFNSFDVRTLTTNANLAILAIYDLTKELKVENAIKPSLAYEYLTKKYKTVSVTKRSFTDTFSTKNNEKYFARTSEGGYYLTHEAESLAESWISQIDV